MDYQRLIFAAHVDELAQKLRNGDRIRFEETLMYPFGSDLNKDQLNEWNSQNSLRKYFAIAYRHLLTTAEVIDQVNDDIAKAEKARHDAENPPVADIRSIIAGGTAKPQE